MAENETRIETDSFGEIAVPADRLWGAQTQRSLQNFRIGAERMPRPMVRALGLVKRAAARTNHTLGLPMRKSPDAIVTAAQEVADGKHDAEFPLVVWQTGSGTQSNMNANEVIANRANEMLGAGRGVKAPVHPNDHVNMGQSSNDTFPTAMHIAAVEEIHHSLLRPSCIFTKRLPARRRNFPISSRSGAPICRTPPRSRWGRNSAAMPRRSPMRFGRIEASLPAMLDLAQGGTAVGTGLNAHADFPEGFAQEIARLTDLPFETAPNKFEALASHDVFVFAHGALTALATGLFKIGQRHPVARIGPALGAGGTVAAGERARLLDHAGQGQSDPGGGADHGLCAGHRRQPDDRLRRLAGASGAQRVQAGDRLQHAPEHPAAGRQRAQLYR